MARSVVFRCLKFFYWVKVGVYRPTSRATTKKKKGRGAEKLKLKLHFSAVAVASEHKTSDVLTVSSLDGALKLIDSGEDFNEDYYLGSTSYHRFISTSPVVRCSASEAS